MAFKTHSGSSFFSLDGVPFTVSEKWKPPKKVTLPIKFETGNPSEFLFLEYDSTVEETLLARFEAERENKKAEAVAAAAAAAAAASAIPETISRNSSSKDAVNTSADSDGTFSHAELENKAAGQTESVVRNAVTMASQTYQKNSDAKLAQRNAAYHMNGNILVPTPIATSGECVLPGNRQITNIFDLTDFENVQDPFENLSLKVINDIEELDKVFLASSKSQTELGNLSKQDNNKPSADANSGFIQRSMREDEVPKNGETNPAFDGSIVSSSLLENVGSSHQMMTSSWTTPTSYPLPSGSYMVGYMGSPITSNNSELRHHSVGQSAESKIPHNILVGSLASSVLSSKKNLQSSGLDCHLDASVRSQPGNLMQSSSKMIDYTGSYVTSQNPMTSSPAQAGYASKYAPHSQPTTASLWPTLVTGSTHLATANNFSNRPLPEVTQNHSVYHNYEPHAATKGSLRPAKSNPDLSAIGESPGNLFGLFGRHTPPIDTRSRVSEWSSAKQPPTRTDVSFASDSTWLTKGSEAIDRIQRCSHEDNLYSSLSEEAKQFVDFVVSMGFPKLQTMLAVQKLGIDEKLVLDHLCAFSKLTEKGYSAKDAETSLFLFDGDLEKAESCIKSLVTFRAMGFDDSKICKALVECGLDEEKSLDWLTS